MPKRKVVVGDTQIDIQFKRDINKIKSMDAIAAASIAIGITKKVCNNIDKKLLRDAIATAQEKQAEVYEHVSTVVKSQSTLARGMHSDLLITLAVFKRLEAMCTRFHNIRLPQGDKRNLTKWSQIRRFMVALYVSSQKSRSPFRSLNKVLRKII